ncbi:MAG: amidophosphoribosyltransferase [Candidatus Marinamargulisbacteria bacterium]|jgi:amidophosphoribosyltransferase
MSEMWNDKCGVFGVFGCKDAAKLCYLGLYALQHRGQESAGIVSLESEKERQKFYLVKQMGLVSEVFNDENLNYLKGNSAIGHVRYSTTGSSNPNNIQPFYSRTAKGRVAVGHNGNLTNSLALHKMLKKEGALFQSTVDTEIILHLISRAKKKDPVGYFQESLAKIEGAYSLVALGESYLVAARDPNGFRPLVLAKLNDGYVVASETCALDLIGAEYIREIEPGEIVYIDKNGLQSHRIPVPAKPSFCVFEHVYFARPDSLLFGEYSHDVRKRLGATLSREHPVDGDVVISVPDSGNSAALGYANESGIPFELGMTRNHYVGRTFIQPTQKIRDFSVKVKLNPVKSVLKGKRVIIVDDSLVRGTTSRARVSAVREAGATEVHLRISSPPIISPCHFGIDTPKKEQLIATQKSLEEIRKYVGADSLGYLSIKGMMDCVTEYTPDKYCTGCFSAKYPIRVKNKGKYSLEDKRINLYDGRSGRR